MSESISYINQGHKMGEDQPHLQWAFCVKPSQTEVFFEHQGVKMMETSKNFYYGKSSSQKIRHQHMSAEGSSAEYYKDLYAEVIPGLYRKIAIFTDSNRDDIIDGAIQCKKHWDEHPHDVNEFLETVELFDHRGQVGPILEHVSDIGLVELEALQEEEEIGMEL